MNATPALALALALAAALLLAAGSASARPAASDAPTALPAVDATLHVFTCAALSRPSQAQVAAWSGQSNQGQVYATRERLMTDVARLCKKPSVGAVHVVSRQAPADADAGERRVAALEPRRAG
jgi:hypothetical protein